MRAMCDALSKSNAVRACLRARAVLVCGECVARMRAVANKQGVSHCGSNAKRRLGCQPKWPQEEISFPLNRLNGVCVARAACCACKGSRVHKLRVRARAVFTHSVRARVQQSARSVPPACMAANAACAANIREPLSRGFTP